MKSLAKNQLAPECMEGQGSQSLSQVDVDDLHSVTAALEGAALVVHTAGPFQRKENNVVLEAAIATK